MTFTTFLYNETINNSTLQPNRATLNQHLLMTRHAATKSCMWLIPNLLVRVFEQHDPASCVLTNRASIKFHRQYIQFFFASSLTKLLTYCSKTWPGRTNISLTRTCNHDCKKFVRGYIGEQNIVIAFINSTTRVLVTLLCSYALLTWH